MLHYITIINLYLQNINQKNNRGSCQCNYVSNLFFPKNFSQSYCFQWLRRKTSRSQFKMFRKKFQVETFQVEKYYGLFLLYTRAQLTGGRKEVFTTVFLKLKKIPWFWKKRSDFIHPWVKFFIKNAASRISNNLE